MTKFVMQVGIITFAFKDCNKQMSCHYSCGGCSANIYYDLCTSCPSTRTLLSNTCICQSGYVQIKQQQCITSSQLGTFDSILINISEVIFYIAIGLHLLSIILILVRLMSPSLKKIVDTFQIIGVIAYYRFLQSEVASQGLRVLNTFNFNYFNNLVCTYKGPQYGCNTFQNLFGLLFTLILFTLLFFVSYFIAYCMYAANTDQENVIYISNGKQERGSKNNELTFINYCKSTRNSLILLYLDQTIIQSTIAISRIAIVNYFGVFIIFPFVIMIVSAVRLHFTTINHPSQTTLAYRAKHSYFYLYDQSYHFNYIDHIFAQQNLSKDGKTVNKAFYPQSNLMIIQIIFKILVALSAIVFYQYQPYLFALLCVILLLIYFLNMQNFFYYQRSTLLFYILAILSQIFGLGTFFTSYFFAYFVSFFSILGLILLIISIVLIIYNWKNSREGQMVKKMYELQVSTNKVSNAEDSQDQLIKGSRKQMEVANDPLQNVLFQNKELQKSLEKEILFHQSSRAQIKPIAENKNDRMKNYGKQMSVRQESPLIMTKVSNRNQAKQLSNRSNSMLAQTVKQNNEQKQLSKKDIPLMTRFSQKNEVNQADNIKNPYLETRFSSNSKDQMNNSKRVGGNTAQKEVKQMPQISQEREQQHNQSFSNQKDAKRNKSKVSQNLFQDLQEL